jgi:hypothetical protein
MLRMDQEEKSCQFVPIGIEQTTEDKRSCFVRRFLEIMASSI